LSLCDIIEHHRHGRLPEHGGQPTGQGVPLADLRRAAIRSRHALAAATSDNITAQAQLHPDLIGPQAAQMIDIARAHGALGWKVNGAGGAGGSLTLLCGERSDVRHVLLLEIEQEDASFKIVPIRLSRSGLRVWKTHLFTTRSRTWTLAEAGR
jgi:hypothetical protein